MAEEETPAKGEEETEETKATAAAGTETALTEGELPESVKQVLAKERKAARDAEKARKAAEARVKEFEDRDKSEQQKLEERAAKAEHEAQGAAAKALRYEVAADKGVPLTQAHRLQGSTKEELEADAEAFLKDVKPGAGSGGMDGGVRTSTPGGGEDMNDLLRGAAGRGRITA